MTGQINPSQSCTRHVMVLGKVNRLEAAIDKNAVHAVLDELEKWMKSPRRSRQRKFDDLEEVLFEFGNDPHSMLLQDINYLENGIWELKHGKLRVLFGQAICDHAGTDLRLTKSLVVPSFLDQPNPTSTCGRSTNTFTKGTPETPRDVRYLAEGIIKEDKNK